MTGQMSRCRVLIAKKANSEGGLWIACVMAAWQLAVHDPAFMWLLSVKCVWRSASERVVQGVRVWRENIEAVGTQSHHWYDRRTTKNSAKRTQA